jgi:hypothetical protein
MAIAESVNSCGNFSAAISLPPALPTVLPVLPLLLLAFDFAFLCAPLCPLWFKVLVLVLLLLWPVPYGL